MSPILANIYLHYALDLWLEKEVKEQLKGFAQLVRYACQQARKQGKKCATFYFLGFSVDPAEMLSSVSYESYRRCMGEYEEKKGNDRIRRRANHDVATV